jgi:hypothetical protein
LHQGLLVPLAHKVYQVLPHNLVVQVLLDQLVLLGQKVVQVLRAIKDSMEQVDQLDHKVLQEPPGQLV